MHKKIDMKGVKFGKAIVLYEQGKTKSGNVKWRCLCDCGNEFVTTGSNIRLGISKSCRCLAGERGRKQLTKHGLRFHPLYGVWNGMRERCNNPNATGYKRYKALNIKVCEEWDENFKAFYDFAVNNGWEKGLTIDRRDNTKGYSPDNCRFVTHAINNQNTKRSKVWTIDGIDYPSARVAGDSFGINAATIMAWCDGYVSRGKVYPKKDNCSSRKLYKTT